VALDPELLGKVFENLLGAFNPETQETARKQTGSFYTPREIVNYMVDESLIAYFKTKVPEVEEETLRNLLGYDEIEHELTEPQCEQLIKAIFSCKILDPSTGSGAFPMGFLQQMVHILRKLDPNNTHWNNVVMAQAMTDFDAAGELSDDEKENLLAEIEKSFDDSVNYPDYARKLYLIENCIYGVDIQSIAVQICKLRFFISLVCEQNHSNDASDNFGIRPLPNLETKFVAANSLIGIEKNEEDMALFQQEKILKLVKKLKDVRHRQFLVTNVQKKKDLRDRDETLRHEIVTEVQKLYVKRADDDIFRLKMQLKQSEKELEILNKQPDVIQNTVELTLFGAGKSKTINVTENKRSELKSLINRLIREIAEGCKYSRLETVVQLAQQLTSWNPYDQNASSPFFDPEWMFGITEGFDIVCGNPPYITYKGKQIVKITDYEIEQLITLYPNSAEYKINSYALFTDKGLDFLCETGIISYIIPSTILQNEYLKNIRKLIITNHHILQIVGFANKVFEAVTDSIILTLSKRKRTDSNTIVIRKSNLNFSILEDVKFYNQEIWNNQSNGYIINLKTNKIEDIVLDKIEINSEYIDDYLEVYVGVVASGIKKFLTNLKFDSHHKKYLQGKHIDNFILKPSELYINFIIEELHSNTDENVYLQNEKILVRKTGNRLIAVIDNEQYYTDQSIYNLYPKNGKSINLKIITALLNSTLLEYYFNKKMITNADVFPYIKGIHLKRLPIKLPKEKKHEIEFEILSNQIIEEKKQEYNNPKHIQRLNTLVFRLYDLSYEEVLVVCPDFWLSEAEYAAVEV
jgi:hypothetical protein